MTAPRLESAGLQRGTLAALALLVLAAWIALLAGVEGQAVGLVGFVAAWTVMMTAMMLPSAAPVVLLHRRGATAAATVRLVGGYLAVWAGTGLAAWALERAAMVIPAAAVLGVAGLYQLTPAKSACLRRCRTPADFLVQRWRPSAFLLGADHGLWCVGCCWALMAVLVLVGMMGIMWVVAIAGVVAAEKLMPRGPLLARAVGVGLLALAVREVVS